MRCSENCQKLTLAGYQTLRFIEHLNTHQFRTHGVATPKRQTVLNGTPVIYPFAHAGAVFRQSSGVDHPREPARICIYADHDFIAVALYPHVRHDIRCT